MIFGEYRRGGGRGFAEEMAQLSESGALTEIIPADAVRNWGDDRAFLAQHTVWNTPESRSDRGPVYDTESGTAVCAWARIDNRDELAPHLGLRAEDVGTPDLAFILGAYKKWGEDCVDHLLGDFAFAVWDARKRALFCARDPMGVRPFYYRLDAGGVLFATGLTVFAGLPGLPLPRSRKWMAEYLARLSMSFDATPYEGILKLPPGHCLRVDPDRHLLRQYHRLDGETVLRLPKPEDYVAAYRDELDKAIRRRLRGAYPLGTELSGGIDSSTVTALAARFMPDADRRLHAFAFASMEQEREHIDAVIETSPLASSHVLSHSGAAEEDWDAFRAKALRILGYPVEHANSTGHEPFYLKAQELGVRTLLSGFGGDEFVTNPASVAMDELWHSKRYLMLYRIMGGPPWRRALRLGKRALLPDRRETNPRFEKSMRERWERNFLRPEAASAYDLQRRMLAQARFDTGWRSLNEFVLGNRWAPFVPTRLENCTLMAAARKIEYRWPLLDARLVQLFLSIPAELKFGNGMGRLLHRRAVADALPAKVIWKPSKYMGERVETSPEGVRAKIEIPASLHPTLADLVDGEKLAALSSKEARDVAENARRAVQANALVWLNLWLEKESGRREAEPIIGR